MARRAHVLAKAQEETGLDLLSSDAGPLLGDLGTAVLRARVDFVHFPLLYYSHVETTTMSLGHFLVRLTELAERASAASRPESVRIGAAILKISLHDLADVLRQRFVPSADSDAAAVFRAVGDDQLEE